MVLKLNFKIPLKDVKISRVVLISGLLTFLYCIEFCIGVRTVYYTFRVWNEHTYESSTYQDRTVSWTLCVACLFTAAISTFSVNVLSAIWEQKQLEEQEKEKSATRFAFHLTVGGIIWRYVNLWCIDIKFQKKSAILLTMTKFLFTQTFTVPMVIVHISILENLDDIIYDVCSIFCISANLILTCTMFSWCAKEVEELKKWDYQTVDLVPLIFQSELITDAKQNDKNPCNSSEKVPLPKKEKNNYNNNGVDLELVLIKIAVFFQTFGFSIGRLLALGILLKLAGIYAVSIMFLQLLVSVIYLKFQTPILVSDSLPKWRQLSRLAFMSYILIFEWHLNRDPKSGYYFSSNIKHGVLYYCVATIESVFYLVTWAITTSYSLKSEESDVNQSQNKFCRTILLIGSMSLVVSLTLHIILLFWRSKKIAVFVNSVQRQYESTKQRLSQYNCRQDETDQNKTSPKRSKIDISSPIMIKKNDDKAFAQESKCDLEKHSSYRDLREPLDDEIEIYFRKCDKSSEIDRQSIEADKTKEYVIEETHVKSLKEGTYPEISSLEKNGKKVSGKKFQPATFKETESNISVDKKENFQEKEKHQENSLKSKITVMSGNISEKLEKVSYASKKVAGSMREQIQKKRQQFRNFKNNSSTDSNKAEIPSKTETSIKMPRTNSDIDCSASVSNEFTTISEDYFVGDSRSCQDESLQSLKSAGGKHTVTFSNDTMPEEENCRESEDGPFPASDVTHKNGDSPCLCYVCKTLGEGRFRRRRSSSVPSNDRKDNDESETEKSNNLPRYVSSPVILRNSLDEVKIEQSSKDRSEFYSPRRLPNTNFDFKRLSRENSVEHYV